MSNEEDGQTDANTDQSYFVSLVLQSKEALQHGERLCTRARSICSQSAQVSLDLLELDTKLKWVTDAVVEQLKLAASVAKCIEVKRAHLEKQAQQWDSLKTERTDALDAILETLGSRVVPPTFYLSSSDSSIFGSRHGSDDEESGGGVNDHDQDHDNPFPGQSPTETLRNVLRNGVRKRTKPQRDRSSWKTLRDFVDERAIEDVLDTIEKDRSVLDDIFATTAGYPENLSKTISTIQSNTASDFATPSITNIINNQDTISSEMAMHLTSLAEHYDKMVDILQNSESGAVYDDRDIEVMSRDADELPAIVSDLEKSLSSIEASHEQFVASKQQAQQLLETQKATLDDLDELGDIMQEMLSRQEHVETECAAHVAHLHESLGTVEDLHSRFTSYEYSYSKLLLELARRRQFIEGAEKVVQGMVAQLAAMVEEERTHREHFNTEHGEHLPSDVCLFVQNTPTRWEVVPWDHEAREVLPEIDPDLIIEAADRIQSTGPGLSASQSL